MYEKLDPSKIDSCVLYPLQINQMPQYPALPADIPCGFFWSSKEKTANYLWEILLPLSKMKSVLRTQVLFHIIQPLGSNKSETSKSGRQGGISLNCYAAFLLGTGA